ncbi:ABC transporter substrate-binding protein [Rhodoferax sp. UBA5149]|uniref:ABC transporter substrate-binding protein n=1 Tax=Rhodoferax sp. UBA5149 TaxID=1947379 RepID=UPI0025FE663E|nr:ABC transporter substrate-binding protein [Rhodoferax sp. UBA5149]
MNRFIAFVVGMLLAIPASALSVAFINPGKSNEAYWVAVAESMKVAAQSLGIELEMRFVERDHPRALAIAQEIATRPKAARPDYVMLTGDYGLGTKLLNIFEGTGIQCFFAFSPPNAGEQADVGTPRQRYKSWIGSLQPHAIDAGYLTAQALIARGRAARAQGPDGRLHLLAIAGDRSTAVSIQRNEGMRRAVSDAGDVMLDQEVYADWSRDKAVEQSDVLYARYPAARLIWAGSDQMAFGAMQSWEKRGGKPGQDAWFSGVNTSREAMDAVKSGRLTALAGGHFIAGAWALVMIYDHANGRDFVDEGLELDRPMFVLFDAGSADRFLARFGDSYEKINFRKYSKVLNPQIKRYNFSFSQLMR